MAYLTMPHRAWGWGHRCRPKGASWHAAVAWPTLVVCYNASVTRCGSISCPSWDEMREDAAVALRLRQAGMAALSDCCDCVGARG